MTAARTRTTTRPRRPVAWPSCRTPRSASSATRRRPSSTTRTRAPSRASSFSLPALRGGRRPVGLLRGRGQRRLARSVKLVVPEALDGDYAIGDELTVTGEGVDYYCNTQFKALQAPVVTGEGVALPTPVDVAPETLAPSGTDAEAYEGRARAPVQRHRGEHGELGLHAARQRRRDLRLAVSRPASGRRQAVRSTRSSGSSSTRSRATRSSRSRPATSATTRTTRAAPPPACAFETIGAYQQSDASAQLHRGGLPGHRRRRRLQLRGSRRHLGRGLRLDEPARPLRHGSRGRRLERHPRESSTRTRPPSCPVGDVISVTGDIQEYYCLSQLNVGDAGRGHHDDGHGRPAGGRGSDGRRPRRIVGRACAPCSATRSSPSCRATPTTGRPPSRADCASKTR